MKNNKLEIKSYSLESSFLFRLRNKRKLEQLLNLPKYYFSKLEGNFDSKYSQFTRPKKNGASRIIENPHEDLKKAHRKFLKYMQRIETPDFLMSGKKGKSYITNAKLHQNNSYVLTMDIKNFYPNCKQHHIYNLFKNRFKMSDDVATALSYFTTTSGHLPTGSPISQLLAFWAFHEMFEEINTLCIENNIVFSLYVDDMTFSSTSAIKPIFINNVHQIVQKHHLELKKSKQNYYLPHDFKLITGVAISPSHELRISNKTQLKIITEYQHLKNSSNSAVISKNRLGGLLNAANQIENYKFPRIKRFLKNKNVK